MIQDFIKLIPSALNDRNGRVFYSGRRAFESPKTLYILGVNPGGAPDELPGQTVSAHTSWLLKNGARNWSAYRDELWTGRTPGTAPLQRRMLHMFRKLNLDPGEVPASNLVFVRSERKAKLVGDFSQLARECWPFHQAVVDRLKVRTILCLGQDPGDWVCEQLGARSQVDEFIEKNNRKWKSRVYRNATGLTVVVATHPSRVDWTAPSTDPTELIQRALR